MPNICVEIKTVCKSCGNPLPVNALVEKVQCASCQSVASFPYSYWKKSLLESALTEYKELSEGEGQPQTLMTGEYTFNITYGNQKPRCRKCKTTLDVNKYDEFVSAGKAVCEKCKNPVTARLLPEDAKQFFPLVKYLFGEDSDMFSVVPEGKVSAEIEKSAKPILFTCPSCAGNLKIDGSSRMITCNFCNSEIYLPDDLWMRLHPVKTVDRWYLVLDDAVVEKAALEKLPDWYQIPGFTVDKDGNCYAATFDDDTGFLVWSFSPDMKTRWVRKGLNFDEEKTGLALKFDGNLYLWDQQKHSLLLLSSENGSTIRKIEGKEPDSDNPYAFSLKGCTTLISDSDGTILALINNTVVRYNETGERVQLWSGKSFGLFGSGIGDKVPQGDSDWTKSVHEAGSHPKRLESDFTKLNIGWDGFLYMIDRSSSDGVIARYNRDGDKLMSVYVPLKYKDCMPWADKEGNMYIIGMKEDDNTNLIRITANGKTIQTLLTDIKEGGVLDEEDQLGLAPDGTVYIYKYYNRIKVFSPDMKMIFRSEQSEKDDNETIKKLEKEKKDKAEFN